MPNQDPPSQTNNEEVEFLKQICVVIFMELQEIKKRLNINTQEPSYYDHYADQFRDNYKNLDIKVRALTHDYPSGWWDQK